MQGKTLTSFQQKVLVGLFDSGLGERGYYLTGGTALAEYYLKHRYSDDLDFFTREPRNLRADFGDFRSILVSLDLSVTPQRVSEQHITVSIESSKVEEALKLEFAKDVQTRMAPPLVQAGVVVDSFEDIAVNKVCTIVSRTESKDYCDLYFILQESRFGLDYLIERAKEKEVAFESEEGKLVFATNLLAVSNFTILPRMIKPLTQQQLQGYLVPLAEALILKMRPGQSE